MRASVVRRDDLEIFVPLRSVAVLVLDAHIGEADAVVRHRQSVLASPLSDLVRVPIGPAARSSPAIALLPESLVVAFQFVVEDHAPDSATVLADSRLGSQVRAVDSRVVRQLAGLLDADRSAAAGAR